MLILEAQTFDLTPSQIALPAAIGGGAIALVLLAGLWMLRRRPKPELPPAPGAARPKSKVEVDPFLRGSILEKRTALRRAGKPVDVLLSDADHKAEPVPGWVIDRSTGGLAVAVSRDYEIGTVLTVRPLAASEQVPWLQIEVRHCYRLDSDWRLSCKFVRTPPYGIMVMFG